MNTLTKEEFSKTGPFRHLNKPSKHIYLDKTSLYGWRISQYLPYGEFKWLNKKKKNVM